MMKTAFWTMMVLVIPVAAHATDYHVSNQGNDGALGTDPATAWLTIDKVNAVTFAAGDRILFRRGDRFVGQINPRVGGPPITFGAYGSGERPIISGASSLPSTGWVVHSGSIHVRSGVSMPPMSDGEAPTLFVNGQVMIPARYPNSGFLQADTVTGANEGVPGETSWALVDEQLSSLFPTAADLEGGHLTAHDSYSVVTRTINSYNPATGQLDFDTLSGLGFMHSGMYFLLRKLSLLDEEGEWYYDDIAEELYVWFPGGGSPSAADRIEYSGHDYGINAWQVDNLDIVDLSFQQQQIAGVWLIRSDSIVIDRCAFGLSKNGILGWGNSDAPSTSWTIQNSTFADLFRSGIWVRYHVTGATISGNLFQDVGLVNAFNQAATGDHWGGEGKYEYGTGIQFIGTDSTLSANRLQRTGRQAISAGGVGVLIEKNVIDDPCLNYNDCGGIMPLGDSVVDHNIIRNSHGPFSTPGFHNFGGRGIYPDFREGDVITNNTIAHTVIGIGLTNSKATTISGNTIYDTALVGLRTNKKTTGPLAVAVTDNLFFGLGHAQYGAFWDNQVDETIDEQMTFARNEYWNPYSRYPFVRHQPTPGVPTLWYDVGQWVASGAALDSVQGDLYLNQPYEIVGAVGGDAVTNGDLSDGTTVGWVEQGTTISTVDDHLDAPALRVLFGGGWSGSVRQDLGQTLYAGVPHVLSFSLEGNTSADGDWLEVTVTGTGGGPRHFWRMFRNHTGRQEHWSVFEQLDDGPVTLRFTAPAGVYYLDNISIYPAEVSEIPPRESCPIFINDTAATRVFDIAPCGYRDLDGDLVGATISVPAYSSQILVRTGDCPGLDGGAADVDTADGGAADVDTADVDTADGGAADVGAADVGAADAGTLDGGAEDGDGGTHVDGGGDRVKTDLAADLLASDPGGRSDVAEPSDVPVGCTCRSTPPSLPPVAIALLLLVGRRINPRSCSTPRRSPHLPQRRS